MQRNKYPELREHTATLILFYFIPRQAPSHKHLHINSNKKEMQERSRDFPGARRPSARLPRASRATCAFRATFVPRATCVPRASCLSCLSCNVRSAGTSSRALLRELAENHTLRQLRPKLSLTPHPQYSLERFSLTELSYAQPHSTVPRPLLSFATP